MNINDVPPEAVKLAPGAAGALAAMLWLKDTWPRRLCMFLAGAAMSRIGSSDVAHLVGLSEGFAGFLLGLFGMAVASKTFETWQALDIGGILRDWIRKIAGLPAKE